MDWIGNIFIVLGIWFVGEKKRYAFILAVIGEIAWIIYSIRQHLWSLAIICLVFAGLAVRNWIKWGEEA